MTDMGSWRRHWPRKALQVLVTVIAVIGVAGEAWAQRALVRPPPSAEAEEEDAEVAARVRPTPPELRRFVEADYPEGALAEGLASDVVLQIEINERGGVSEVEVVEPAGHGFDEAAVAAVRQFEFEPARLGDQPIASRIIYRYRFELQVEEPSEDESTREVSVTGQVTDLDEVAVSGAQVLATIIEGEDRLGEPVTALSDDGGTFRLGPLPPGRYQIQVEASGFVSFRAEEPVQLDDGQELTFRLAREDAEYETVIRARRPGQQMTTRSIDRREVNRVPGASGDPMRVIQNLPGMNRTPLGLGLLIVRGSAPQDTSVLLESVDIPLLYHFGGLNSVINPRLIEAIDFLPGNYPVRYGGAHGGIIEVRLRELQQEPFVGWHGELSVDIIDAQLQLEGPIVDDLAFAVAARRSYVDAVAGLVADQFDGFDLTTAPVYWDWQAILQWTPSSRHFLRVIGYGSDDRLRLVTSQPPDQGNVIVGAITNQTSFNGAILQYRYRPEGRTSFTMNVAGGQSITRAQAADVAEINIERVGIEARPEVTIRAGDWGRFLFGARLVVDNISAQLTIPNISSFGGGSLDIVTRPWERSTNFSAQIYAEAQLQPTDRLRITTGLHAAIDGYHELFAVEPRLWMRYQLLEGTAIEGGIGSFHQEPGVLQSDPFFGNPNLGMERGVHYGIGLEQRIWGPLALTVNGFYKTLDRLGVQSDEVEEIDGQLSPIRFADAGLGRVYGLEVLLRAEPTERFFGWLSYTLMRSERRDGGEDPWTLFAFDQTHILTLVAGVTLPRGWEIGLRFQLTSGRPNTPVVGGIYQAESDSYQRVNGEPLSERMPFFHQLDLRIDKTWTIRRLLRVSLYLDVQNVYFNRNVEGYFYSFDFTQRYQVTGLPILPSLGISAEF